MKIDETSMRKIAAMAAIEMDPDEMESQRQDLERIAVFTARLNELDTEGLPEQTHPFDFVGMGPEGADRPVVARFREDIVTNKDIAEEMIAAAPDSKGLYLRTPRTVEE